MNQLSRIRKAVLSAAEAISLLTLIVAGQVLATATPQNSPDQIRLTVLYDNTTAVDGMQADWGFACLVEEGDKTILFDAGAKADILDQNAKALGVDLGRVNTVIFSHEHGDHTGGLPLVLGKLRGGAVPVYAPQSFSAEFDRKVEQGGLQPVKVKAFQAIRPGIYLTGEMGGPIKEQGLLLDTSDGPLLITGCAHPGIADMVRESGRSLGRKVSTVLGGFHLLNLDEAAIKDLVTQFLTLGVKKCGATHCTGEKAIRAFQEAFGPDFLALGVGRQVAFGRAS